MDLGDLARRKDAHLRRWCHAGDLAREVPRRALERVRPEPREAEGIERPPVDRDGDARTDESDRFRRASGVEMAGTESRSPTPHRQKRDVDLSRELSHLGEEVGIPG